MSDLTERVAARLFIKWAIEIPASTSSEWKHVAHRAISAAKVFERVLEEGQRDEELEVLA